MGKAWLLRLSCDMVAIYPRKSIQSTVPKVDRHFLQMWSSLSTVTFKLASLLSSLEMVDFHSNNIHQKHFLLEYVFHTSLDTVSTSNAMDSTSSFLLTGC